MSALSPDGPVPIPPVPEAVLLALKAAVGEGGWSQDPERLAPKLVEWRGRWRGRTPLLLTPRDTEQVAAVVRLCAQTRTPLTPQGGNTGLVAGQIPQGEVLLSLGRMNAVRAVSALDEVMVVEAGATLAQVHEAAAAADRRFPLNLASEGSCTVGGLVSTNAGGTAVLRYGTMRELVLGLEAVLPDGAIWRGLRRLRKDNTGYDLKQLLIGAEGTLGVVTAASLKLFPIMASRSVAMAGVARAQDAVALLALARAVTGGAVEAFELISRTGVDLTVRNIPGQRDPLAASPSASAPWRVLIETASGEPDGAETAMERLLAHALEAGLIADAVLAQNQVQARALWALRENQSAGQKAEGPAWKHDVSVPVGDVPDFLAQADAAMQALSPGCRVAAFGHLGDGNIHYDVLAPAPRTAVTDAAHEAARDAAARRVHDIVAALEGSISAEHGLGAVKVAEALRHKAPAETAALRAVRAALDPLRIMNPRVLF